MEEWLLSKEFYPYLNLITNNSLFTNGTLVVMIHKDNTVSCFKETFNFIFTKVSEEEAKSILTETK